MNSWMKYAPPLALSFVLATMVGCGESQADLARKPFVIDKIAAQSSDVSVRGPVHGDEAHYKARLKKILEQVSTQDLETLRDHNITITLDQRLSQQTVSFWGRRIDAVLYNHGGSGRTLALWDNGKDYEDAGILSLDAFDYGPEAIKKLAERIRGGYELEPVMYAARYTRHIGKTTSSYTRWDAADGFSSRAIKDNPELVTPPLRALQP